MSGISGCCVSPREIWPHLCGQMGRGGSLVLPRFVLCPPCHTSHWFTGCDRFPQWLDGVSDALCIRSLLCLKACGSDLALITRPHLSAALALFSRINSAGQGVAGDSGCFFIYQTKCKKTLCCKSSDSVPGAG